MALTEVPAALTPAAEPVPVGDRGPDVYDVLVLDGGSRQSLAVVRSLGRAGLRVAVAECFAECDPSLPVLAFRSRYAARTVVFPSFAADLDAFAAGVVEFVRNHPTRVVLPASDGAIAALLPRRRQLAALGSVLALSPDTALTVANDKDRTLEVADRLGIEYPKTARLDRVEDVGSWLTELELPIVLKPTMSWACRSDHRLQAVEVVDEAEAVAAVRRFVGAGAGVLAQQWVGGRREGVTLFVVDGAVRASFAHVEHRTTPALGGASVVRESIPMPSDLYEPSVRLVTALGLEGYSEVEFRRDGDGRPLLMEINARVAGPIETAVRAGVDFPLMVWRRAVGLPVAPVGEYETGVRMRWLRGDMRWLRDNHRRTGRPDSVSRPRAAWTFVAEFFRSGHYDCFDRHDRGPGRVELRTTVVSIRQRRRVGRPTSSDLSPKGVAYVNG
ncbi:MAG TPA: ATP-grasp domain-containing protein [Acidimicrobiales bacterium]